MNYFLVKTDPETYSIDQLQKEKETIWDGVHSYAAINFIKQMKPGDKVFIYHSQGSPAIVGLAEVISDPYQNEKDPRPSFVVKIRYSKTFVTPVTLKDIKATKEFDDWALIKQGRLSVMPAPKEFVAWIKKLVTI